MQPRRCIKALKSCEYSAKSACLLVRVAPVLLQTASGLQTEGPPELLQAPNHNRHVSASLPIISPLLYAYRQLLPIRGASQGVAATCYTNGTTCCVSPGKYIHPVEWGAALGFRERLTSSSSSSPRSARRSAIVLISVAKPSETQPGPWQGNTRRSPGRKQLLKLRCCKLPTCSPD